MEDNNKKVLTILLVIFGLMIFLLGIYVIFDKIVSGNCDNNEKCEDKIETVEKTSDERYKEFAAKLKSEISSKYDDNNNEYINARTEGGDVSYSIKLDKDGNLYLDYANDEYDKLLGNNKVSSNVLMFYLIETGNGKLKNLYFINESGNVGMVALESFYENKIEIKNNVDNLKNIVSIVPGSFSDGYSGAANPIFIDIDGNMYY